MKICYASYMWGLNIEQKKWHQNLDEVVQGIADLGFAGVVFLSKTHCYRPNLLEMQSTEEMENITRIINKYDLDAHLHIAPMIEDARKENKNSLEEIVDYMKNRIQKMVDWIMSTGKAKVVSFDPLRYILKSSIPSRLDYRLDLRVICDLLQITADMVADYDVKVAIETSGGTNETCVPYELSKMMEFVNRKNVGVLLDIGHANLIVALKLVKQRNLAEYIKAIQAEIVEIHLHDNHGQNDEHLNPGEGNIDFESAFLALKEIGFKGNISLEAGIPPDEKHPIEHIKKGKQRIEELLHLLHWD